MATGDEPAAKRYVLAWVGPLLVLAIIAINLVTPRATGSQVVYPAYVSFLTGEPLKINYAPILEPADLELAIRRSDKYSATFLAMKEEYPSDYARFLEQATGDVNRGKVGTMDEVLDATQGGFRLGKLNLVVASPDSSLAKIADAYAKLVRDLRTDNVDDCATFGRLGRLPPRADGSGSLVKADVDAIGSLEIRAAKAAEKAGSAARGNLTAEERAAWNRAMDTQNPGASELWAGPAFETATAGEQCDATVALFAGAANLPDPASAKVMAQVLLPDGEYGWPKPLDSLRAGVKR